MSRRYDKLTPVRLTPENLAKLKAIQASHPLAPSLNVLANLAISAWHGKGYVRHTKSNPAPTPENENQDHNQ